MTVMVVEANLPPVPLMPASAVCRNCTAVGARSSYTPNTYRDGQQIITDWWCPQCAPRLDLPKRTGVPRGRWR